MPDEVTLDVTTIEENVTVETTAGDVVEIQVVAPAGPAGATGAAGPNSVTSATTSDGTANLSIADLEVVGGEIYTDGDYSQIYTQGTDAHIFTLGSGAEIFTEGALAQIYTTGASAQIYTAGAGATIGTQGANATIYTQGTNATISTAGSAAHIQTSHASAAVKSTNFAAVESGGASLVDGSFQPCLTWSAGGRNLTIPSGTATTFNTTSYTYGTGAAAAHRTALGLTTLATTTPAANVATFLETPTSANLAAAVTGETGSGALVFATSPTITTPTISGTATVSGSFGVGTVSPQTKFDVNAGTALYLNSFNIYGSSTTGAGSVFGKISNTNTAGRTLLSFSETPFDAVTPSSIQRFGSTHSSKPNLLEVFSSGAIELIAGSATSIFCSASGMIGIGTTSPNAKAVLDLTSTTRGFLPPRMTTTQRNDITSVPAGLMVYNTTTNKLNFYNGSAWEAVTSL
jgi:hypothetical protein